MTKSELRNIYKEKRSGLSVAEMGKFNEQILDQFRKIEFPEMQYVHTYIPSARHHEPDTRPVIRLLKMRFPRLKIAAPRIKAGDDAEMEHYIINHDARYRQNSFGIDEPEDGELVLPADIDLALVPMVCFDKSGNRVGHGKGYYDRFLAGCRPDMLKVGLSFFEPVPAIDDSDGNDIRLDYCCTPFRLYLW